MSSTSRHAPLRFKPSAKAILASRGVCHSACKRCMLVPQTFKEERDGERRGGFKCGEPYSSTESRAILDMFRLRARG